MNVIALGCPRCREWSPKFKIRDRSEIRDFPAGPVTIIRFDLKDVYLHTHTHIYIYTRNYTYFISTSLYMCSKDDCIWLQETFPRRLRRITLEALRGERIAHDKAKTFLLPNYSSYGGHMTSHDAREIVWSSVEKANWAKVMHEYKMNSCNTFKLVSWLKFLIFPAKTPSSCPTGASRQCEHMITYVHVAYVAYVA